MTLFKAICASLPLKTVKLFLSLAVMLGLGLALFITKDLFKSAYLAAFNSAPETKKNLVVYCDQDIITDTDIINLISRDKSLALQRGIGTIPTISTSVFFDKLRQFTSIDIKPFRFSINYPELLKFETNVSKLYDFGGIILYDSNLGSIDTLEKYKALVREFKEKFSFNLTVKVIKKDSSNYSYYNVEIHPFIVADSDLSYKAMRYCRGPLQETLLPRASSREEHRNNIRTVIGYYKYIGLNSTLSPDVDFQHPADVSSVIDLAKFSSVVAAEAGLVPVLKHFVYDRSLGDAHKDTFFNPVSNADFFKQLSPYFAVEDLGIPYMIMLSHHSLPLDPDNPLPRSVIVSDFVSQHFKNAITMSDEIKMGGLSKKQSLYELTRNLKTDVFLFHSGNLLFSVSDIIKALQDGSDGNSQASVRKFLMLKHNLGLVKISKIE